MKNFKQKGILILVVLVLFAGCSTISLESNLAYPVSMTKEISDEYSIISHFEIEQKAFFTVGGLITFKDVEFDRLVNNEVTRYNGDGAVNVKIVDQQNATDILIDFGLSLGGSLIGYAVTGSTDGLLGMLLPLVISSRTVTIEGDVIKKVK